jgi:hypothetical protein
MNNEDRIQNKEIVIRAIWLASRHKIDYTSNEELELLMTRRRIVSPKPELRFSRRSETFWRNNLRVRIFSAPTQTSRSLLELVSNEMSIL